MALAADRLGEWVTIHRELLSADPGPPRKGMRMQQRMSLRGAPFKVTWELADTGVKVTSLRPLENGKTLRRVSEAALPTLRVIPNPRLGAGGRVAVELDHALV